MMGTGLRNIDDRLENLGPQKGEILSCVEELGFETWLSEFQFHSLGIEGDHTPRELTVTSVLTWTFLPKMISRC